MVLYAVPSSASETANVKAEFELLGNDEQLEKSFRSDPHWRGADGAYSFPVETGHCLWLFGDTFIATKSGAPIKSYAFINNTAAQLQEAPPRIRFFWNRTGGHPDALLRPANSGEWYWPGDGIVDGGRLLVFMKRVVKTDDQSASPEFRFKWATDDLLSISHPWQNPVHWRSIRYSVPEQSSAFLFGTACVLREGYFYAYCSAVKRARQFLPHPVVLARIPLSKLEREDAWEYWSAQAKKWTREPVDATTLFEDGAPEMTVTYSPALDRYVAVYMPPLKNTICLRTAPRPEGPFSDEMELYACKEADITLSRNKHPLVYSAKAHPELCGPDELLVTYCVNPGDETAFRERPDLYFPKVLRFRIHKLPQ